MYTHPFKTNKANNVLVKNEHSTFEACQLQYITRVLRLHVV